MHGLRGRDACGAQRGLEDLRMRFRRAHLLRTNHEAKVVGDTNPPHVRIAIGDGTEHEVVLQMREHLARLVEHLDLVARLPVHLEARFDEFVIVAAIGRQQCQPLLAQAREIVMQLGPFAHEGLAMLEQVLRRIAFGNPRITLLQPEIEATLGALNHGRDKPQRVVEIKGNATYRHALSEM